MATEATFRQAVRDRVAEIRGEMQTRTLRSYTGMRDAVNRDWLAFETTVADHADAIDADTMMAIIRDECKPEVVAECGCRTAQTRPGEWRIEFCEEHGASPILLAEAQELSEISSNSTTLLARKLEEADAEIADLKSRLANVPAESINES